MIADERRNRAESKAQVFFLAVALWSVVSCTGQSDEGNKLKLPSGGISAERLKAHVQVLAGDIGERNTFRPNTLRRAADYIEKVWREQGYDVVRHEYEVHGGKSDVTVGKWANLEVTRRGSTIPEEIILVGAHYDSAMGSPGANDNATGVAALLEISRLFAAVNPGKTVRFVAFVNEELFKTTAMGSRVYAKKIRERGDNISAMVSLETLGSYNNIPGSQRFPYPAWLFKLVYPAKGNFVMFVSNWSSRPSMRRSMALFRAHSDFPVESIATFEIVPGVDWSDHSSFWEEGYPAFMVTDTAPYRDPPYYHTPLDTPDKINYEALTRVTEGLYATFKQLCQ
jgi:hypothetical protein